MAFSKSSWALSGAEVAVLALVVGPALGWFYSLLFLVLSVTERFSDFRIFDFALICLFLLPFSYAFGAAPALMSAVMYWKIAAHVPYAVLRILLSTFVGPVIWIVFSLVALAGFNYRDGLTFALTGALPASISLALIFEVRGRTPVGAFPV